MKRIRVRRSRPSALALALALMLTMFAVFLVAESAGQEAAQTAGAQTYGQADISMEGMQAHLEILGRYAEETGANIAAAQCMAGGGAGLVVPDGDGYAVVYAAHASQDAYDERAGSEQSALVKSSGGLTMRVAGSGAQVAAISQAVDFLRTQAVQTGSLASSLEGGGTDAGTMQALLRVYLTQGRAARDGLSPYAGQDICAQRILSAVENSIRRIEGACASPTPGSLRRVYAAGRLEWIGLLEGLRDETVLA